MSAHVYWSQTHDIYEPIVGFSPILANHDVNVWSAAGVVTGIDGCQLHNAVRVSVPSATKEGLRAIKCVGAVPGIVASCVGLRGDYCHRLSSIGEGERLTVPDLNEGIVQWGTSGGVHYPEIQDKCNSSVTVIVRIEHWSMRVGTYCWFSLRSWRTTSSLT